MKDLAAFRNFTLIELLTTVAVIAVLASLLLPSLSFARSCAKDLKCASSLKRLGVAGLMYSSDYADCWPMFYNKNGGAGSFWYNNYWFMAPFIGKSYNGSLTGDFMIPPALVCPNMKSLTLVSGLASATCYGMNSTGFSDAGVNPLYNAATSCAYKMTKIFSPSTKLAHLDSAAPSSGDGYWCPSQSGANIAGSCVVGYRHKGGLAANALFFDCHAAASRPSDLYQAPRASHDCWDVYDARP